MLRSRSLKRRRSAGNCRRRSKPPVISLLSEAVPGDDLGWTHRETTEFRRRHAPFVPKINDELQWLATGALAQPVRQYLSLAIDCAYPTRARPGAPTTRPGRPEVPAGAPPLIAYRTGICIAVSNTILAKVREEVPRFIETGYFMSRAALITAKNDGGRQAKVWLDENYKRFPQSPAVTYISGQLNQFAGDCKAALKFYEETLAMKPEHEVGLIGRTVCLTYLKRTDEAIAEATHMIDLKTDNIDEAYYWRAWNHYTRQALDLARADIDLAKSRRATPRVLHAGGHDRARPERSRRGRDRPQGRARHVEFRTARRCGTSVSSR